MLWLQGQAGSFMFSLLSVLADVLKQICQVRKSGCLCFALSFKYSQFANSTFIWILLEAYVNLQYCNVVH